MKANASPMMKGNVLHRVRSDHPVLKRFKSGEDEFLKGAATIYWQTMAMNPENPRYSPIGIPHSDIDVLHPDGRWRVMTQIPILSDAAPAGWRQNIVEVNGNVQSVFSRIATRSVMNRNGSLSCQNEACILLRHPSCCGTSLFGNFEAFGRLVLEIGEHLLANILNLRWFYAYEDLDEVRVQEFFPIFHRRKKSWLKRIVSGWLDVPERSFDRAEINSNKARFLMHKEVSDLYRLLGCSEALIRGHGWSYEHLLFDQDTYASLKGSSVDAVYGAREARDTSVDG